VQASLAQDTGLSSCVVSSLLTVVYWYAVGLRISCFHLVNLCLLCTQELDSVAHNKIDFVHVVYLEPIGKTQIMNNFCRLCTKHIDKLKSRIVK
jgi:hypothetical protein